MAVLKKVTLDGWWCEKVIAWPVRSEACLRLDCITLLSRQVGMLHSRLRIDYIFQVKTSFVNNDIYAPSGGPPQDEK